MNKAAIKNYAIWARNKLIADIQYRAGLMGITADVIKSALPQSTKETEFYDIGTSEPYSITGDAIIQRSPKDIHFIDPCMGSGHILVYAFDVLMQIYESAGYSERDAAKSILENNLYGLDIDDRAYQMAYFAVMMKARQYNRRILSADLACHVYSIQDSNSINRNQLKYFGLHVC